MMNLAMNLWRQFFLAKTSMKRLFVTKEMISEYSSCVTPQMESFPKTYSKFSNFPQQILLEKDYS